MNARLIILIVVAAGLAVYFATRASAPASDTFELKQLMTAEELEQVRREQSRLGEFELPGEEVSAELFVRVEIDPTDFKNRLYLYITEAHGYYVEEFDIELFFTPDGTENEEDQIPSMTQHFEIYLQANSTLRHCMELVPPEIYAIGGTMGTSENWRAAVRRYGRARVRDPESLPPISDRSRCP